MGEQLEFPTRPNSRAEQIFTRFVEFHKANPQFWNLFCRFADNMRRVKSHYSARAIIERARWEADLESVRNTDDDELKLNDHYIPYYARMYLALYPDAEGFFELRKRTSQDRAAYKIDISFPFTGPAVDEEGLMLTLAKLAKNGS